MNDTPHRLDDLEERLGVKVRDTALLQRALIHRSYLNENPGQGLESNERLEFLGDAILGFVIGRWLYRRYPELPEGQLTEMRATLVRRETLAEAARELHLGEYLLLGKGEDKAGGRTRDLSLACAYEAVVGAIAEDRGVTAAERFALRTLAPGIRRLSEASLDAKSRLQHLAQARWHVPPRYEIVTAEGPDHAKVFTVSVSIDGESWGTGVGNSKQDAEQSAALHTLNMLAARGVSEAAE